MKRVFPNCLSKSLLLVIALGAWASTARANPLRIAGFWNIGDDSYFEINGPSLALGSDNPAEGGPGPTVVFSCPSGSCVLPPQTGGPFPSGQAVASGSGGTFNGVAMYDLTGFLSFTGGSYTMPSSSSSRTITLLGVVPFDITGMLVGYGGSGVAPCCPFSEGFPVTVGVPLFSFQVAGSGNADIYGFPPVPGSNTFTITDEQYNFSGTATVTPEPTTFLMFGLGFALLACAVMLSARDPRRLAGKG